MELVILSVLIAGLFHSLFGAIFFFFLHFLCFMLSPLLFELAPKPNAEMLSNVPKCKKAVMFFMKKNMCIRSVLFRNEIVGC